MSYCSCFNDALRLNKTKPWVSPEDRRFCNFFGEFAQAERGHLTRSQLKWLKDYVHANPDAPNPLTAQE
jgi:hypothetical protein